jgi:hypothetical protein
MHNNNVGLTIGANLREDASFEDVCAACDEALESGKLIWIQNGMLTKPATYMVEDSWEWKSFSTFVIISRYERRYYKTVTTDTTGKVVSSSKPFTNCNNKDPF